LNLPAGCAVQASQAEGGLLYVRSGPVGPRVPGCARVTVIDPATGRIIGTVTGGP
jgi:hypothetical protein